MVMPANRINFLKQADQQGDVQYGDHCSQQQQQDGGRTGIDVLPHHFPA